MARESKVTLKSSDDELFEVNETVALESILIKSIVELHVGTATAIIPLLTVSSKILSKVIEYCEYHVKAQNPADENSALTDDEIKTWDREFVKVDQDTLFGLILAADFLRVQNLLDLTCQALPDMMKEKTREEVIREIYSSIAGGFKA